MVSKCYQITTTQYIKHYPKISVWPDTNITLLQLILQHFLQPTSAFAVFILPSCIIHYSKVERQQFQWNIYFVMLAARQAS